MTYHFKFAFLLMAHLPLLLFGQGSSLDASPPEGETLFHQSEPPTAAPSATKSFTMRPDVQPVSAALEDLHADEWDINFAMLQQQIHPQGKALTEEDRMRSKAKKAYRMWKMQNGGFDGSESSVEPEAEVFNPDGSIKETWMQKMLTGEIEGFDWNAPEPQFDNSGSEPETPTSGLNAGTSEVMVDNPLLGVSVQVTNFNWATPPDGGAATNAAGQTVTASNNNIVMYDEAGNVIYSETQNTFFSSLNPTAIVYDPRVIYDTHNNRWIIIYLHGNSSSLNEFYLAFSQTSDPTGSWNFYKPSANYVDTNLWFDYPQAGYNDGNLFISGNMFTDGNSYQKTVIFMCDLNDAYNGMGLTSSDVDDVEMPNGSNAPSVHPCSFPFGAYGPGAWLINRQSNSNDLGYFFISAGVNDNPTFSAYSASYPSAWGTTGTADQAGSTTDLGVPDRMMNTYVNPDGDDKIHFTFSMQDGNGDHRIVLGRLNTNTGVVVGETFGAPGFDYATPWIQPWAANFDTWDGSSCIGFSRVSSTSFPAFRAIVGHPVFGFSPLGSINVKAGQSAINSSRWGDYLGGSYREGQSDPECWIHGQYGLGTSYGGWLAQITRTIEVYGCTDPQACNYDPDATDNDGSCDYSTCVGCTDSSACNFNPAATDDDGSCTYPGCTTIFACNFDASAACDDGSCCFNTCVNLEMPLGIFLPTFGINTVLYYSIVDNATGEVLLSGNNFSGSAALCLESGCYSMSITGAAVDWALVLDPTFQIFGVDYTIESGTGQASFDFQLGEGGENAGCTDATACNYDVDAICDNGTCCYASCLNIDMTDSYGDGWNNNVWVIENGGEEVATGTLESDEQGVDVACLAPGCYQFSIDVTQGLYPYEVGWSLSGSDVNPSGLSGGPNDAAEFTIGDGGDDMGCTVLFACNFDPAALCDDGSCCYDNCVDLIVTDAYGDGWNYATMTLTNEATGEQIELTMEDGSVDTLGLCLEGGCYDVSLTSGIYPEEVQWFLDYQGAGAYGGAPHEGYFMLDVNFGCTDAMACNYSASATCDDNTCEYPGCTDPDACNYNECTSCGDASLCEYGCLGCTYATATNFAPAATMDDGSCTFDVPPPPAGCQADIDGDGQVGVSDLLLVLGEFGDACVDPNGQ